MFAINILLLLSAFLMSTCVLNLEFIRPVHMCNSTHHTVLCFRSVKAGGPVSVGQDVKIGFPQAVTLHSPWVWVSQLTNVQHGMSQLTRLV